MKIFGSEFVLLKAAFSFLFVMQTTVYHEHKDKTSAKSNACVDKHNNYASSRQVPPVVPPPAMRAARVIVS